MKLESFRNKLFFIRVDGSHIIGLGHIYRIKILAKSLVSMGCGVVILTLDDKTAVSILQNPGAEIYTYTISSYDRILERLLNKYQPDLLIYDCLETSRKELTNVRQINSSIKILTFDDIGDGLNNANVVINSFACHWNLYNPSEVKSRLFEGSKYMIMQSSIDDYVHEEKDIVDRARNIFIAFGGTDTHYVTERALAAMNKIMDTLLNIKVNLGPGSQSTSNLLQIAQESCHRVEVLHAVPNLFQEFCQADLILCAGGNMLYEIAALGVPAIAIATEKHEIYNTKYWSNIGSIVALGWERELEIEQITDAVYQLIYAREQREQMSKLGKKTVDNQGLSRVLTIIEDLLSI